MSTSGDIMMHVGDIISRRDIMMHMGGYHEYIGVFNIN